MNKLDKLNLSLIDGSAFAYIHAGNANYKTTMFNHMNELLNVTKADKYCIFFEKSITNFRHKAAITQGYKAQRAINKAKYDPENKYSPYLKECQEYLKELGQELYYGVENDDAISITHNMLKDFYNITIVGEDSDLLSMQALHYRIRKKLFIDLTPQSHNDIGSITLNEKNKVFATGIFNTYSKLIKGSTKENYKGIEGYGDKKVYELLKDCKTENDLFQVAHREFYNKYKEKGKERLEEGYRLSYLIENNIYFELPILYDRQYLNNKITIEIF